MSKPPLPSSDMTWRVNVVIMQDAVRVETRFGNDPSGATSWTYVKPPNFIERWFGRTYERKIADAQQRMQKLCDQRNKFKDNAETAARLAEKIMRSRRSDHA